MHSGLERGLAVTAGALDPVQPDQQGGTVVAADTEMATQQAALLLNVSRPYLIGLLEAGQIDYRLVGSHRRVKVASLLAYKHVDDQARAKAADELTALSQEMGLLQQGPRSQDTGAG
jgi:excisionase family DNA binding protein